MGNACFHSSKDETIHSDRSIRKRDDGENNNEIDLLDLAFSEHEKKLEELFKKVQKHNLERMKEELNSDLNGFILNNLLLCVQFCDNFERNMTSAREFKHELEKGIGEKLTHFADDGVLLGERKISLMHGFGHILSQNYIYKEQYKPKGKRGHQHHYSGNRTPGNDEHDTFTCESLLPLEFIITWDNLEVHKESEWDSMKEYQYSSAKGSPKIYRFCFEEPDEKNKIEKGYARLRCVDMPLTMRPKHPVPNNNNLNDDSMSDYVYDVYSNTSVVSGEFQEKVQEVQTESDALSSEYSEEGTDEDAVSDEFASGADLLSKVRNRAMQEQWKPPTTLSPTRSPSPNITLANNSRFKETAISHLRNEKFPSSKTQNQTQGIPNNNKLTGPPRYDFNKRRLSGVLPRGYAELDPRNKSKEILNQASSEPNLQQAIKEEAIPSTSTSHNNNFNQDKKMKYVFEGRGILKQASSQSNNFLKPPTGGMGMRRAKSEPRFDSHNPSPSSGYDSMSPNGGRSRSSSIASEDVRQKWRASELKALWQFPSRRRLNAVEGLPESCFQRIQIEVESDSSSEEEPQEDDESETESDNSSLSSSSSNKSIKDPTEPKFEDRTYLNSIEFSTEFCCEFKQIGKEIGINESSLNAGVVLGTTIRCAVEYPQGLGLQHNSDEDNLNPQTYAVLHTFTPSVHSHSWPQKALIGGLWWTRRKFDKNGNPKWPFEVQSELIEQSGCNVIPMGYRSIHSTQAENLRQQTLEWKIGFANAETILLNSFKHVHWRCLTFSGLIFRAFIAPLGPLGIGLEHFRNVLYFMCREEFILWNEEEPGNHLKSLLARVLECLSKNSMGNFFIKQHNMLKNIPTQNTRKIQAHLASVKNNLLIYCIFAMKNLRRLNHNFYPRPKLKKLYKILTARKERDILMLANPILLGPMTNDENQNKKKKKKKKTKIIDQTELLEGEEIDAEFDTLVTQTQQAPLPHFRSDREQKKLRRKRNKWERLQERRQQREDEEASLGSNTEDSIQPEFLKEIYQNIFDLEESPVKRNKFSPVRLGLVLKFFIEHFIQMAEKSNEFEAYSQASMYVQQTENLIEILQSLPNELEGNEIYKEKTEELRAKLGFHLYDYIKEKVPSLELTDNTIDNVSGLATTSRRTVGPMASNWDFRKLPTPPASMTERNPSPIPTMKKLPIMTPNLANSLRNIPISTKAELRNALHEHEEDEEINNNSILGENPEVMARRTPSIKYIPSRPTSQPVAVAQPPVPVPVVPTVIIIHDDKDEPEQESDSELESSSEQENSTITDVPFDNFLFGLSKIPRAHLISGSEYEGEADDEVYAEIRTKL